MLNVPPLLLLAFNRALPVTVMPPPEQNHCGCDIRTNMIENLDVSVGVTFSGGEYDGLAFGVAGFTDTDGLGVVVAAGVLVGVTVGLAVTSGVGFCMAVVG
jgi:hypothetical protein